MSASDGTKGQRPDSSHQYDSSRGVSSPTAHQQDPRMTKTQHGQPRDPRLSQQLGHDGQPMSPQAGEGQSPQYQQGGHFQGQPYQPQQQPGQPQQGYEAPQQQGYHGQPQGGYAPNQHGQQYAGQGYGQAHDGQAFGHPAEAGGYASDQADLTNYGDEPVRGADQHYYEHGGAQDPRHEGAQPNNGQPGTYGSAPLGGHGVREADFGQPHEQNAAAQGHYAHSDAMGQQAGEFDAFRSAAEQVVEAGYGGQQLAPTQYAPQGMSDEEMFNANALQTDASFYEGEYEAEYEEERGGGNRMLMAGVVVGAIGLVGALGYAYQYGPLGGQVKTAGSEPPLIVARNEPNKETPEVSGGKEFGNGGKMFYDRLTNDGTVTTGSTGSGERIVTRQEAVIESTNASANLPPKPAAPTANSGGPRKVTSLKVLPNGRIIDGSAQAAAQPAPAQPAAATPFETAAVPAPAAQPARRVVIPAQPAPAASGGFVVQIAARKSEGDARSAFGTLQRKYPNILGSSVSDIQRADLGAKGVWYRLRVGPGKSKENAVALCDQLKAVGQSCLVKPL